MSTKTKDKGYCPDCLKSDKLGKCSENSRPHCRKCCASKKDWRIHRP